MTTVHYYCTKIVCTVVVITSPSGIESNSYTTNTSSVDSHSVPANNNNAACVLVGTLAMMVHVHIYSFYRRGVAHTRLKNWYIY